MLGTNYTLENSQKMPPRVVRPSGASMLTHGWLRTIRTAQNLHNADIQWAERCFNPYRALTNLTISCDVPPSSSNEMPFGNLM